MALTTAGVSLMILLVVHFALVIWAVRKLIKHEKISGFEKISWFLLCLVLPLLGPGLYAAYGKKIIGKRELLHITIAIIIYGFLFSFRQWGVESFNVGAGINNWLRMSMLALIALGGHIAAQKAMAKYELGYSRYRLWGFGIGIGIALIFLTNGWFIWAAIGCASVGSELFLRPGKKNRKARFGRWDVAKVMAAGAFASMGLAILGKILIPYFGKLPRKFMIINIWIAVFSVIPLLLARLAFAVPGGWWSWKRKAKKRDWVPLEGSRQYGREFETKKGSKHTMPSWIVFEKVIRRVGASWLSEGELLLFGSKSLWVFTFVFVVITAPLLLFLPFWASLIAGAVLAIAAFAAFSHSVEPKRWGGG